MLGLVALVSVITTAAARVGETTAVNQAATAAESAPELLSAYRFFRDAGAREPNAGVTPYDLNTALYSDGALKFRYVYVPPGVRAQYRDDGVFEFPVGTVLIKTFAFAADMRWQGQDLRFLETRLLVRRASGWEARAYVWNEAQTEARLTNIGASVPVRFIGEDGAPTALDWAVPNRNQCKGCHDLAGQLTPVGPTARNLNRSVSYPVAPPYMSEGMLVQAMWVNQLRTWRERGLIDQVPADPPRMASAFDTSTGSLNDRARAYLDVNCANCHNPDGPAHTSGLDLRWNASPAIAWGVGKRPVAAGRGSAGMAFAIDPGHPERSFLLHRMESLDPGIMMPELGRQRIDTRAVALMREWIGRMDADGNVSN